MKQSFANNLIFYPNQLNFFNRHSTLPQPRQTPENLSYFHQVGPEKLRFVNIGQVLKQTAEKFPDRESVVSCSENTRLTFAETLDKVIKKFYQLWLWSFDWIAGGSSCSWVVVIGSDERRLCGHLGTKLWVLVCQHDGDRTSWSCLCKLKTSIEATNIERKFSGRNESRFSTSWTRLLPQESRH